MNDFDTPDQPAPLGMLAGADWLGTPFGDGHGCPWCVQLLNPAHSDLRTPGEYVLGTPSSAPTLAIWRAAALALVALTILFEALLDT